LPGDGRLLRRLVRNLLDNARRYAGKAPVEVTLARSEHEVVFSVRDRGPGVPESERERIFEPFYRAHGAAETAGGVGLGLALVRSIAHQHGGSVACLARDGGGSEFRVTLPLA
jgi:signal transduction histidine kinase